MEAWQQAAGRAQEILTEWAEQVRGMPNAQTAAEADDGRKLAVSSL